MDNSKKELWYKDKWSTGISPVFAASFIIILLLMVVFIIRTPSESENSKKIDNLSKGFSIISIVLIIYVIYTNINHNNKIQEQTTRQQSFLISKELYINMIEKMSHDFPETYFLYNEIANFDPRTIEELEKVIKYDKDKRKLLDAFYSEILIELFQNFLSFKQYLVGGQFSWVKTFYYQFQSPILQKRWLDIKDTYDNNTNALIQQFIDIGKNAKENNWESSKLEDELIKIDFRK